MARAVLPILLVAAAVTALAGCGGDDDSTTAGATAAKVDIVNFRFKPKTITIEVGGKITWLNSDVAPHTATAGDRKQFDTGTLRTGQSDTVVFSNPGTFSYVCLFHPFMVGKVEVVD
jgi:plastocyanin